MIGNITNGGSPGEAARYIAGPARDEHGRDVPGTEGRATLIGSRGFGFELKTKEDVELAIRMMEQDVRCQASLTKPVQNTVIHMTNSWHPGYTPSREEMLEARDHFAQAMGMESARSISWSHDDTPQAHTHTMFSGIDPDTGYAFPSARRNEKVRDAAIEWERARGQVTPARQPQHDEYDRRRAGVEQERDAVQQAAERDDYVRENGGAAIGLFKAHGQETWPRKAREYVSTKKEEVAMGISKWWKDLTDQDNAARRSAVDGLYRDHRAEWNAMQDQAAHHYGEPPRTRLREIWDDVMRQPTAQQIRDNRRDTEEWHKTSERNHASAMEGIKNGTHEFKDVDGKRTLTRKTIEQAPQRAIEAPRDEEWRGYKVVPDPNPIIRTIDRLTGGQLLVPTEETREKFRKAEEKLPRELPGDGPQTRKNIEETWKRNQDDVAREVGRARAEREEQGRELPPAARQESHADGAAGKGRPDRTEVTRRISFQDQVAQVTRNVKPQEQPIGRDRGLDR